MASVRTDMVNSLLTYICDCFVTFLYRITNLIQFRFYDFLLRYDFFFRLSANRRKQLKTLAFLHGYTDSVISARRKELTKKLMSVTGDALQANDDDVGSKKRMAFLDLLLQSTIDGRPLTDLELREEVDTFMFEGHDTTTSAISFLFHSLAHNPHVQQKVFDEVRRIIGDDRTKPITMAKLNEMHYLELVIKETLRLYPSVPMFGRKMMENTEISKRGQEFSL